VRDEAEIRGHRRTYVGALPGRVIQAMKQAGTSNPVIMLDEIDKLGADFRGDPAAALLEVLDPEQNARFSDHFLNLPFDLSKVLFIATANMLEPIPGPLRDRMEVIRLAGYTPEEKADIAARFLIPRQIGEHGLVPSQLEWSKNAIELLTAKYTHEAGVRNLERKVAAVCRKVARKAAEGDDAPVRVTQRTLARYLGPAPFEDESTEREPEIGVVQGLAWTEAGGDVLTLEANLASGKGLTLTGQLGDVMKESGQTAHSFVRSLLREIDADDSVLSRNETHVHVPAGATPKDGPSAGVTIATAIVSVATGTSVRSDVAMTGEVTLRGRVLAVGGVREKALAALRAGIRRIILPRASMKDAEEIPKELRRKLELIPVSHMREVLDHALVEPLRWRGTPVRLQPGAQTISAAVSARED
jgi:ATP-dependent Lon protease